MSNTSRQAPAQSADDAQPESLRTVLIALAANALVAVAKSFAAAITGSASMVAESAHSWADTGNQIFLFIANRRSVKPADDSHPVGYGREAYVWSLIAAFGLFAVGAVISVMHGVQELFAPEPASDFFVSYIVLGFAFLLEGTSFLRALTQARGGADERDDDVLDFVIGSSDPTLRAVFFEDAAALIGLVIAFAGIFLHQITGSAIPDAVGSILVGLLLGVVALVLIAQNRRFLVGVTVDDRVRSVALREVLSQDEVVAVSYLHIEYVGPNRVLLIAAIDLAGDAPEHTVADRLNVLESRFEQNPRVQRAVLTLSRPGAIPLSPG